MPGVERSRLMGVSGTALARLCRAGWQRWQEVDAFAILERSRHCHDGTVNGDRAVATIRRAGVFGGEAGRGQGFADRRSRGQLQRFAQRPSISHSRHFDSHAVKCRKGRSAAP